MVSRTAYIWNVRKACYDVMSRTSLEGVTRRTVARELAGQKLPVGSNRDSGPIVKQFKAEMLAMETKLPPKIEHQLLTLAAGEVPDEVRDAIIQFAEDLWTLALAAARLVPRSPLAKAKQTEVPLRRQAPEPPPRPLKPQPLEDFLPDLKAFVENMLRSDLPTSTRITRPISPAAIFRRLPLRLQTRGHSAIATDLRRVDSDLLYITPGGGWWRRDREISDQLATARPKRSASTTVVSQADARRANDKRIGSVVEYLRRLRRPASREEIYAGLNLEQHEIETYRTLLKNRSRVDGSLIRKDERGRYFYTPRGDS